MSERFNITFRHLAATENSAATELLITGLDSRYRPTREGSLRALLERRDEVAHAEIFKRLPTMDEGARALLNEKPERLAALMSEALRDPQKETRAVAFDVIEKVPLYDCYPSLIARLVDEQFPEKEKAAQVAFKLAESFYAELSGGEEAAAKRANFENLRTKITTCLEDAVRKFHRHRRPEVVEAFLLLAKPKNATLHFLLGRNEEAAYETLMETLRKSQRGGVYRILLSFLDDSQISQSALRAASSREDAEFLGHFFRHAGVKLSKPMTETLSRIDAFTWAKTENPTLLNLDETCQAAMIQVLMASACNRKTVREIVGEILLKGNVGGRRAAAVALASFTGVEANVLNVSGLADEDSAVRAALIRQLRPRKIPGSLDMLIRLVDKPDVTIQRALRDAMPEFTIQRYLQQFFHLPEELQAATGHLVCRIDSDCASKLISEMCGLSPVRRRRAVLAADAMGMIEELEQHVIKLLSDDDHMVRVAAAKALADCASQPSWEALRDAMLDRSFVVQEAAVRSMELISRSLNYEEDEEDDFYAETHSPAEPDA